MKRWRLMRWHRRIGAILALVLLLLAVTGLLLNHSGQLKLAQRTVDYPLVLALYGIEVPEPTAFAVGKQWLSHWGGTQIYLQDRAVAYCAAPLSGAIMWRGQIVAACVDTLVLLTPDGDEIERLGSQYDLPVPITGLAAGEWLILQTPQQNFRIDLERMSWQPVQADVSPVVEQSLPAPLAAVLRPIVAGEQLTFERVIADIHSGRILGAAGVWLADLAALGIVFVALSGFWCWLRRH